MRKQVQDWKWKSLSIQTAITKYTNATQTFLTVPEAENSGLRCQ